MASEATICRVRLVSWKRCRQVHDRFLMISNHFTYAPNSPKTTPRRGLGARPHRTVVADNLESRDTDLRRGTQRRCSRTETEARYAERDRTDIGLPLRRPKKQKPSMRSDSLRPLHLTLLLARRHGTTEVPACAYCTVPAPLSNSEPQVAADHDRAQRTGSRRLWFASSTDHVNLRWGSAVH
jgi:hypothetical protein